MAFLINLHILLFLSIYFTTAMSSYNIVDYGAKADGHTDAANALHNAWAAACASNDPASIYVPNGKFFISRALLKGPCKNTAVTVNIDGKLIAPSGFTGSQNWIAVAKVKGLSIVGGTLDGRGHAFWECRKANQNCPTGATSLSIIGSKNVLIKRLTSLNSEAIHIALAACSGVKIQGVKIKAPADSPNTDGIHITTSGDVTVIGSTIKTGDDCISIGRGTSNMFIQRVRCGPGHGISIGSLGQYRDEDRVQNITVTSSVFNDTQNGVRIKTWGKPYTGFVKGITFQHLVMNNVQNPLIIDQNYCPSKNNCPGQSSGIKISQVLYSDIQGTSATQIAVKFDCSWSNPCSDIALQNIKLTYLNNQAESYCKNVQGTTSGYVTPPSCL